MSVVLVSLVVLNLVEFYENLIPFSADLFSSSINCGCPLDHYVIRWVTISITAKIIFEGMVHLGYIFTGRRSTGKTIATGTLLIRTLIGKI